MYLVNIAAARGARLTSHAKDAYKHCLWPQASSLIKKETLKKRISNIEQ